MVNTHCEELKEQMITHANMEMKASRRYLAANFYAAKLKLSKISKYFLQQYHDETSHGLKMYEFLHKKDWDPHLGLVDEKIPEWKSLTEVFKYAYDSEMEVSQSIEKLMVTASKVDQQTYVFLSTLALNQVEEVERAHSNYEMAKAFDDGNKLNLYLLDREFE